MELKNVKNTLKASCVGKPTFSDGYVCTKNKNLKEMSRYVCKFPVMYSYFWSKKVRCKSTSTYLHKWHKNTGNVILQTATTLVNVLKYGSILHMMTPHLLLELFVLRWFRGEGRATELPV